MITKLRLSDNASLGNISTNARCEQSVITGEDSSSGDSSLDGAKSVGECSSGQQSIADTKWSTHKKQIPGPLASDDSCNAVDNKLSDKNERHLTIGGSDLSFNGRIKPLMFDPSTSGFATHNTVSSLDAVPLESAAMNCELIDATKGFERGDTEAACDANSVRLRKDKLNKSLELLTKENSSWIHYKNEQSPDLFTDDDDYGMDENRERNYNNMDTEYDDAEEVVDAENWQKTDQRTSGTSTDELHCADKGKRLDTVERVLLKRLQSSLSGVPPPPSLTFTNIDVGRMLALYHCNVKQWWDAYQQIQSVPDEVVSVVGKKNDYGETARQLPECLSKPTHLTDELAHIEWPHLLKHRAHGLHYNKSTATEKFEQFGLKYVERYIGAETSSSFNITNSPSSAKKRNQRMKMLNQSPGSRLSHLARRRAIFSSANLLNNSGSSGGNISVDDSAARSAFIASALNRLNPFRLCNRQVRLDPKKSDNRRKNKIKTPQRRSPALGRKSPRRQTSGTSATKLSLNRNSSKPSQQLHVPATRESSKRALFLSPPNGTTSSSRCDQAHPRSNSKQTERSMFSDARMLKSKRTLFSPPRESGTNTTSGNDVKVELLGKGCTSTMTDVSLKRRRSQAADSDNRTTGVSGERLEKMRRMESFALTDEDLTPRSLKFTRSQSFCVGSQTVSAVGPQISTSDCSAIIGGKSLYRATSEITSEDGNRPVMMLTENHKKKLLWAVSQALKEKQVPTKHEMFKQHASNLARVVKRLFLEFNDQTISSTSDKLLRLANKHVYEVIQGKSVDDIYFREKTRIMNARNLTKLQGYIAPEEYELRKLKRDGSIVSMTSCLEGASPFDDYSLSASQTLFSQSSIFSQGSSAGGSFSQFSEPASRGVTLGKQLKPAPSTSSVNIVGGGALTGGSLCATVLRENIDSELRQRSTQKQLSFSGRDQKNVSPYGKDKACPVVAGGNANAGNNKLLVGGALNSSIMKAKRQISFE